MDKFLIIWGPNGTLVQEKTSIYINSRRGAVEFNSKEEAQSFIDTSERFFYEYEKKLCIIVKEIS